MLSFARLRKVVGRHLKHFIGPGLVASVAYVDPGNWATDLQAGAHYGSKLLFVVFIAGIAALLLQILSVRIGAVTSKSLPRVTRELILSWEAARPQYKRAFRALLWTLWALAEIAIIATDLAELLGSAIALNLLFPKLPLYAGVLITAADVMIVLVFFSSSNGRRGMLFFEILIVVLVLAVFISFMILLDLIKPPWREIFFGLVPSKTLVNPGALYIGVGIIGATVMPHALFLGSHLASIDRLDMLPRKPSRKRSPLNNILPALNPMSVLRRRRARTQGEDAAPGDVQLERMRSDASSVDEVAAASASSVIPRSGLDFSLSQLESQKDAADAADKEDLDAEYESAMKRYESDIRAFDRIRWVDLHVNHGTVDTAYSLLGFALTINSAILTLAAAAYYFNRDQTGANPDDADIFGAHALIKDYIGAGAGIIFALALLCAGQSASITATLAGQVVSEGFLEWRTSPMVRRLITRLIGVVPAATVAAAVGPKGLDDMLVASQVILCIVLPTVSIPLVYICSRKDIMVVDGPLEDIDPVPEIPETDDAQTPGAEPGCEVQRCPTPPDHTVVRVTTPTPRRRKTYASPLWVTIIGYVLCAVVILANGYVIVQLALGNG